jgi:hypothetical protein
LFSVWENEEELAQLDEMVRYTRMYRKPEQPMDIIVMGVTHDPESKEEIKLVEQRADLGATWWLEAITPYRFDLEYEDEWPVEAIRERVLKGPPQMRRPLQ